LRKTRFPGKRLQWIAAATVWLLSLLACSQSYMSQADIAATAGHLPTRVILPATATATATLSQPVEVTSLPTVHVTATLDPHATPKPPILYYTQAGDTLASITGRFGVREDQITSDVSLPPNGLISPNVLLVIPDFLGETTSATMVMPDSEVVYSPSAASFDIIGFVDGTDGYLKHYSQQMGSGNFTGAEIIKRVALEIRSTPTCCSPFWNTRATGSTVSPPTWRSKNTPWARWIMITGDFTSNFPGRFNSCRLVIMAGGQASCTR